MSKKIKFSSEQEEIIIDYVKSNEILYNVKSKEYRDGEKKNRLWLKLADQLEKDVEAVKKKWVVMRDYFMRNRDKKRTGSAASATTSKRDQSLMFLLDTSLLKRSTISNIPPSETEDSLHEFNEDHMLHDYVQIQIDEEESQFEHAQKETATEAQSATVSDRPSSSFSARDDDTTSTICRTPQNARNKRKHASAETTTDVLREFLQCKRPNPMNFMPPTPPQKCGVQQFFDSMATTVKTFPPLSIAKVKLQIANIVGEEEIACAERNALVNQKKNKIQNHLRTKIGQDRSNDLALIPIDYDIAENLKSDD